MARAEAKRYGNRWREGDEATANSHLNLFPEAKEAKLRRAGGHGHGHGAAASKDASGVPQVPLGGNDASKRKLGVVPFYGCPPLTSEEGRCDDATGSFCLGALHGRRGAAAANDITRRITGNQYKTREDHMKHNLEPMGHSVGTPSAQDGSGPMPASSSEPRRAGYNANAEGRVRHHCNNARQCKTSIKKGVERSSVRRGTAPAPCALPPCP